MYWGSVVISALTQQYEQEENYEMFELLTSVIRNKNKRFGLSDGGLPTRYSEEIVRREFKSSPNKGDVVIRNMPYYIRDLRDAIEALPD